MKKILLGLLFLVGLTVHAQAAACFWVGGTGNWSDATHWDASSGGAGSDCAGAGGIPGTTDTATMDANSCASACTITIDQAVAVQSWTWGACTNSCTIDNSGNHNVTVTASPWFSGTGTGTRTFNGGTGTYTINNCTAASTGWQLSTLSNLSNPTTAFASATIVMNSTATTGPCNFSTANATYGTVTFNSPSNLSGFAIAATGGLTIHTVNVAAPNTLIIPGSATTTVDTALNITGTSSSNRVFLGSSLNATSATLARSGATIGTLEWLSVRAITVTGGAITANNSYSQGFTSGWTITEPTIGGGGGICIGC